VGWWWGPAPPVKATGPTGHGSRFIPNPATHKVVKVINKALEFRAEQEVGPAHYAPTTLRCRLTERRPLYV